MGAARKVKALAMPVLAIVGLPAVVRELEMQVVLVVVQVQLLEQPALKSVR